MFTDGNDMGSIALGIDASDASYLYLTGGLYTDLSWCSGASFLRSADKGISWTRIPLNDSTVSGISYTKVNGDSAICLAGNGEGRGMGNRIAAKGTTIYLATNQNGLLKSVNRGDTWATVSQFGNTVGIGRLCLTRRGIFMRRLMLVDCTRALMDLLGRRCPDLPESFIRWFTVQGITQFG
jgi:photosystem II stability/assembly factor-like uncharacterized protein